MVPADDEHKSANEAEKNTSTRRPLLEKLKFWKRCKQEDDKPARLTPMPRRCQWVVAMSSLNASVGVR